MCAKIAEILDVRQVSDKAKGFISRMELAFHKEMDAGVKQRQGPLGVVMAFWFWFCWLVCLPSMA